VKSIVEIKNIRNSNDFKLLLLGWIFDINFLPTLKFVWERNYLEMIFDKLPTLPQIDDIFCTIKNYMDQKIEAESFDITMME